MDTFMMRASFMHTLLPLASPASLMAGARGIPAPYRALNWLKKTTSSVAGMGNSSSMMVRRSRGALGFFSFLRFLVAGWTMVSCSVIRRRWASFAPVRARILRHSCNCSCSAMGFSPGSTPSFTNTWLTFITICDTERKYPFKAV